MKFFLQTLSLLLFAGAAAYAQALYPVSLEEKFSQTSLIAEGKVLSQYSFWNPAHTMIFTDNTVALSKIFSGTVRESTVEILTVGGVVGTDGVSASELLRLSVDDQGVFFLQANGIGLRAPRSGALLYDVYSSVQGFLGYDKIAHSAGAPFASYQSILRDLYPTLEAKAGHPYRVVGSSDAVESSAGQKATAPSITSFSPANVRAGAHYDPANNTLTITGTGFGSASGSAAVVFKNADNGGTGTDVSVPYSSALIGASNWSSTQIVVRVPERAGTGVIKVLDNTGAATTSATPLIVDFAVMTVDFGATYSNGPEEVNLMNFNGAGGYTVTYSTATAGGGVNISGTPEQAAFQRALNTHKTLIGFNVTESATTTTSQAVADDGVNIIQFDNTNTGQTLLGSGTLAVCYSWFSKCGGSTAYGAQKKGFDITIRDATSTGGTSSIVFTSGPCPPASTSYSSYDLETVLLHEIGHAEDQLHVIEPGTSSTGFLPQYNPAAVMNYAITNGTKRNSPDKALLTCGQYAVAPSSLSYGSCGLAASEMTPLTTTIAPRDECSAVNLAVTLPLTGNAVAFNLANVTSNRSTDPQATAFDCSGNTTSITNTQYFGFKTAVSGSFNITVSGYSTTPAAQSACTGQGVGLALYQVSACPAGGAYPAPVACRTFSGNGALASITGLAANTSYLLVADGIENTKAAFSLSFGGTSLPIHVLQFSGQAKPAYNLLSWTIDHPRPGGVALQRSSDGIMFRAIADFAENAGPQSREYRDTDPENGAAFYRIAAADPDGSLSYSEIVKLTRENSSRTSLSPNPANSVANLQCTLAAPDELTVTIRNAAGALVYQCVYHAAAGANRLGLPTALLPSGFYTVQVRRQGSGLTELLKLVRE